MIRAVLLGVTGVAAVAALSVVAVVALGADAPPDLPVPSDVVQEVPVPEVTPEVLDTPDVVELPTPSVTPTPTPPPEAEGASDEVAAVQQQLTDLRYYVGPVDGVAGPATASAVQAFQKVNGLVADGVIGPNTVAALASPVIPTLRGGPGNRVEVDLDRQVLYLVQGGDLARILPVSTGSGSTYANPGGGTARSLTPVGDFRVERHIRGVRNAPLGTLYDPLYFHRGWAIHGSNSVPSYPASHGCVRVTRADAVWLFDRVPIGTTVSIYGNTNAFSPALGETAGTAEPAGDTAETTPDDGIQDEDPAPTESSPASAPTPEEPAPQPPAPEPEPSQAAPVDPGPESPGAGETDEVDHDDGSSDDVPVTRPGG